MSPIRAMPPSATCSSELAWPALTAACFSAVTSALILVPTASDAASSDAFTIREPLDSLANELEALAWFCAKYRRAVCAGMLVVPVRDIESSFYLKLAPWGALRRAAAAPGRLHAGEPVT